MEKYNDNKSTPTKRTSTKDGINLDYDYNSEYGDGDIPDIDKPHNVLKDKTSNKKTE
ncbi:hypothetical protein [Anaeromicropila herbilytica]|uniref:Uncharacterized protein n=1 Tax=Anaeromicropila herbilytica TaxID=2785025 RepID=A0A7R7ENH6_9FIRM|nr:hypothetical protein [Anaeromicropila herbilytica]BCN32053.1 hypothetical protein bsdtb5_33480 [Anaeromicropila herbilytica]